MKIKIKMKRGKKRGNVKKIKLWDKRMTLNTYSHVLARCNRRWRKSLMRYLGGFSSFLCEQKDLNLSSIKQAFHVEQTIKFDNFVA
ncbi:hypothetical protein CN331_21120 [Bacillus cereus]|nr:hypothetical protein CN331_21120 [Bacillus cereus]